jgi:glycerol-3-phosphate O-acyltransferase
MAFLNRKMRQLSKGVYIQQKGFDEIRRLLNAGERVVLMPVFRSFADLPVLLYSLFINKIEIPFTIGNAEDMPATKFIDDILKKVGYIISTRTRDQSLQSSYTNQAVIREIIKKHRFLLMFQNDLRIRSGKFNNPTMSDISVQWLLQAYLSSWQKDGKNVYVIPVSINYERLFEIRNIADMMVSNDPRHLGLLEFKSKFDVHKGH